MASLVEKANTPLDGILRITFSIGAFVIYYVFYRANLLPKWLTLWGLGGAIMYAVSGISVLFGVNLDFLMAPLAIQEMVMAVWLIIKGFNSATIDDKAV